MIGSPDWAAVRLTSTLQVNFDSCNNQTLFQAAEAHKEKLLADKLSIWQKYITVQVYK